MRDKTKQNKKQAESATALPKKGYLKALKYSGNVIQSNSDSTNKEWILNPTIIQKRRAKPRWWRSVWEEKSWGKSGADCIDSAWEDNRSHACTIDGLDWIGFHRHTESLSIDRNIFDRRSGTIRWIGNRNGKEGRGVFRYLFRLLCSDMRHWILISCSSYTAVGTRRLRFERRAFAFRPPNTESLCN